MSQYANEADENNMINVINLGGMNKEKWEIKKLGEVCEVQRGLTYSGKDVIDFSDKIVLRATNIDLESRKLIFDELKFLDNSFYVDKKYQLKKDSLLICFSSGSKSHLGKIALVDEHYSGYYFGGFIGQITPKKNINPKYLFYTMSSPYYKNYIENLTDGVNINNLKTPDLKNFQIPVPPLSNQQRIVSYLDQAFEAIEEAKVLAEKNLENAKELFESYLQDIFEKKGEGWEERKLEEICVLQRGFDLPTRLRVKGKFPLVSSNGITDKVNQFKVKAPGVVTGRSGTIGNVHFIEEDFWPLNTSLYIKEFYDNDERFIYYFLKYFRLNRFSSGAGVPTLNRNNVHSERVHIPTSLSEQRNIVESLDALHSEVQRLESIYEQKIADLEEMKQSVLDGVFLM